MKVDPVGFDSRGVWYGHKTYGIMDQKHLRLSVDRLAAVRTQLPILSARRTDLYEVREK